MPLDKIYYILDQINELGGNQLRGINLNALGEPMMHPDIFKILRYMRNSQLRSRLISNGSLLNSETLSALAEDAPDVLHISMDVLNGQKFSSLRGTAISFDTYLQAIIKLISLVFYHNIKGLVLLELDVMCKFYIGLRRVLSALPKESMLPEIYYNKDTLYKDLTFFLERINESIPEFTFVKSMLKKNIDSGGYYILNKPAYTINDSIVLLMKEYLPLMYFNKKIIESGDKKCRGQSLIILNNGNVSLCCLDYRQEMVVGNIFDESLESILIKSKKIAAILANDATVYPICRQCKNYFSRGQKIIEPLLYKRSQR
jgi:radical SAM protein with 4Fe4S-binding SPASM domain